MKATPDSEQLESTKAKQSKEWQLESNLNLKASSLCFAQALLCFHHISK
jgi:hypothetical protein